MLGLMTLPGEPEIREILTRTALLRHRYGKEMGRRPLVLPDGKFFPDPFAMDEASARRLLERMQAHAGLTDIPLEVAVLGAPTSNAKPSAKHECAGNCQGKGCNDCDGSCHHHGPDEAPQADHEPAAASCGSSCSTGCGQGLTADAMSGEPRLVDLNDRWRIQIPAMELKNPVALTTNLARTLGVVFLAETSSPQNPTPAPLEVSAELTSCLLGFGGLLLAGSYVYSKSCGGPRIGQLTLLPPFALALATVLFARLHGHDLRPLQRGLEITQREALRNALDWLGERPGIVERFVESPERLAQGDIPRQEAKPGLLARWFGNRTKPASDDATLAELEALLAQQPPMASKPRERRADPKTDELRSLVDEALAGQGPRSE